MWYCSSAIPVRELLPNITKHDNCFSVVDDRPF